mmetsp:Transcript_40111/g.84220  ORF Transcript_40111/g.84220 Transcript_40111/m.84220 type:complete len:88 (-) Transcript_40111:1615-1878(-)
MPHPHTLTIAWNAACYSASFLPPDHYCASIEIDSNYGNLSQDHLDDIRHLRPMPSSCGICPGHFQIRTTEEIREKVISLDFFQRLRK